MGGGPDVGQGVAAAPQIPSGDKQVTQYEVVESSLHEPMKGTVVATFDTREEADDYVSENDDDSLYAGYGLFVQPASDK